MSKPISKYASERYDDQQKLEVLPLIYSCDGLYMYTILNNKAIITLNNEDFNENLLVFFYGKPSFHESDYMNSCYLSDDNCPVCFILPFDHISTDRVFSLDTADFAKSYQHCLHRNMKKEDFELDNSIDSIMQYIQVFFGNNQRYLEGEPAELKNTSNPYVDALHRLQYSAGEKTNAHTVEVLSRSDVEVKNNVECIVLPDRLARKDEIKSFLADMKIQYITYKYIRGFAPCDYTGAAMGKVLEYIDSTRG